MMDDDEYDDDEGDDDDSDCSHSVSGLCNITGK